MLLKQREFAHLTSLHRMAVIVAALSCCAGNVGTADDQLCERNHELAVLYGHLHPQRLASVAVCFGVAAASKDADIFADLTPKEAARMRCERCSACHDSGTAFLSSVPLPSQ